MPKGRLAVEATAADQLNSDDRGLPVPRPAARTNQTSSAQVIDI